MFKSSLVIRFVAFHFGNVKKIDVLMRCVMRKLTSFHCVLGIVDLAIKGVCFTQNRKNWAAFGKSLGCSDKQNCLLGKIKITVPLIVLP